MAIDADLLQQAAAGLLPPVMRLYAWDPPAVSLGRFQDSAGIREEEVRRRGWDVVRRPTGGRAVLHQHEVTYAVVLPPSVVDGVGVRDSYAVLTAALNAGLRSLIPAWTLTQARPQPDAPRSGANCFAAAAEADSVTVAGKLVGSAQARSGGALLQHGSILLDLEIEAWQALFGDAGRPISLADLAGRRVPAQTVEAAVEAGFRTLGIRYEEDP